MDGEKLSMAEEAAAIYQAFLDDREKGEAESVNWLRAEEVWGAQA